MPACSQFAVEFAGDFVTQNGLGHVTALVPDGTTDFLVTAQGGYVTRWYGLPRDVDDNGRIWLRDPAWGPVPPQTALLIESPDVLPLRDIYLAFDPTAAVPVCERGGWTPPNPALLSQSLK